MNGADAIANALRQADVEIAFGLPGVHNMALWPAFASAGIRILGSRHEQGCAYAADGYARATGKLAVVLVTTGPGAANTIGAVGEAWASKSPVLIIATDIPSTQRIRGIYRGVLHECTDQAAMFAPVTKLQTRTITAAISEALRPPYGPTYFEIPTDQLGTAQIGTAQIGTAQIGTAFDTPPPISTTTDNDDSLAVAVELLQSAAKPLIWIGGGARNAEREIDHLARMLGAPVLTTYSARGVLPSGHPYLVPAPPHEPQVTELISQSDCTIIIGSDLDAMNTMAWKLPLATPRIAINVDAIDATKNYTIDAVVIGDAAERTAAVTQAISDTLAREPAIDERRAPWFDDLLLLRQTVRDEIRSDQNTAESLAFLERTELALPKAHMVFADMCIAGYWLAGHYSVQRERGLHYPMGWGTLGWAFPAAIGAAAAAIPSVAFMGDGGMLFAIGELATVAQEQLPLTIVVVDDGGYGMLRYPDVEASGCELHPVDFAAVARSFGIDAVTVYGVGDDYAQALAKATTSPRPTLLHVHARLYPPRTTSPRWPLQ